ncbi:hypothetical protein [Streptomyces coffeae]|uniref:Protein phosphatase n=1 Tax=Streptomyces coffeae TaxID=621382 RepID=A0ABS1N526_9ACTN|nr:hypothetical protein [Streptomyces coffeae]MBL1095181.1 hypothetical protein [Streptomyces coffeae]
MIKPEEIPQYTGDLDLLEKAYTGLKKDAGHIRTVGADVHSHFQGLSAYYKAPEAEQLFATTQPVKDRADGFADDVGTVATALSEYATEIRPLVTKLANLKTTATTFVNDHKGDDDWQYDEDKVDEHNQLRDDITRTVAAFWAAERTCHNKITALFHGAQMVAGDGSDRENQYGFNADDMAKAKLPWGDPVEEKHHAWEIGHWVKSFVWDGLIVDGVWGTLKGLGTLVGFGGWDAMGKAWKGLAQLATGLAITSIPGAGTLFWALPDDKLPSWLRDSRTAMKETGKALVAWDEWGKNPGRAAGAVTFNVLTTVFTGGAGGAASGAGKAGAVAKTLAAASKAGKVIDPMTYITKGAGAGLSKIGDIAKGLKGIESIDIPQLPDGTVHIPEGSYLTPDGKVHLPDGSGSPIPDDAARIPKDSVALPDGGLLPPGSVKLPGEGAPRFMDTDGNIYKSDGSLAHDGAHAPRDIVDRPAGSDVPRVDSPTRQPDLVAAGARTPDNAAHINLGGGLDDIGRLGDDLPGGRVGDDIPGGRTGDNLPGGRAGDNLPGGRAGDNLPGGHAGDNLPGGHAHDHGPGPSASHEPPSGNHGDGPNSGGHHGESGSGGHSSHNDGPSTGSEGGPTGPTHEAGQIPSSGGHPEVPGGAHPGSPIDEIAPDRYSRGSEASHPPTEPMRPEQEAALTDALTRAKMAPQDQASVLRTLRKEPFGAEVADLISRGHLSDAQNYNKILDMCKQASSKEQKGMVPAAYMALTHATELQNRGFNRLAFELEDDVTGLDLDVTTLHPDGTPGFGYQLKDVDNISGIRSAAKKAGKQLLPDAATKKFAILDVHQSLADLNAKMFKEVEFQARKAGATFQLRFHDGSITVPPNRPVLP